MTAQSEKALLTYFAGRKSFVFHEWDTGIQIWPEPATNRIYKFKKAETTYSLNITYDSNDKINLSEQQKQVLFNLHLNSRDNSSRPYTRLVDIPQLGSDSLHNTHFLDLKIGPLSYREFFAFGEGDNQPREQIFKDVFETYNIQPIGVEVIILTTDGKTLFQRRPEDTLTFPEFFHVTASGYMDAIDVSANSEIPCPFNTAITELKEELRIPRQLSPSWEDITIFGISRNTKNRQTQFLGIWYSPFSSEELNVIPRLKHIKRMQAKQKLWPHFEEENFTPEGVERFLRKNRKEFIPQSCVTYMIAVANKFGWDSLREAIKQHWEKKVYIGFDCFKEVTYEVVDEVTGHLKSSKAKLAQKEDPLRWKNKLEKTYNRARKIKAFLCHVSEDKPAIRALFEMLRNNGVNPWFDDESLIGGQNWNLAIQEAIESSDIVIVCLSKNSTTKSGYIQKELKHALDIAAEKPEGEIFIIPTRLEECDVPKRLCDWHWVNLYENNGFAKLKRAIKERSKSLGLS